MGKFIPRNILLVRTDRIGDVVLITPAIDVLRRNFPDAKISVLTTEYTKDLLKNNPAINQIITDKPLKFLVPELKVGNFDSCVLFFVNMKAAAAVFGAGIPVRIGPASKIWSLLLTKMVKQRRSKTEGHEADFNTALLKELGCEIFPAGTYIRVTPEETAHAAGLLAREYGIGTDDKFICIHPGSKGSAKNWPPDKYAALARAISGRIPGYKILLTGAPAEFPLLESISEASGGTAVAMRHGLPLSDLIAVISRSKLLVTNSTGPLHIADALKIPTVSFFPLIKGCSEKRWGPYGAGHIVLKPAKECSPCAGTKCGKNDCMATISEDEAFEAVSRQLAADR